MTEQVEHSRASAIVTTDRDGNRAYVWPDGHHVARDGYGRMAWSLYRPEDNTPSRGTAPSYFTDTLGDAIGNI